MWTQNFFQDEYKNYVLHKCESISLLRNLHLDSIGLQIECTIITNTTKKKAHYLRSNYFIVEFLKYHLVFFCLPFYGQSQGNYFYAMCTNNYFF